MGFGIRVCTNPNIISNRAQSIKRDSVILQYDDFDYQTYKPLYTSEDFGCENHEKKVMQHL